MTVVATPGRATSTVPFPGLTAAAVRWRWFVLPLVWIAWSAFRFHEERGVGDWAFFRSGVDAIFSPRGLSLYADRPDIQIGPLALVLVSPLVGLEHLVGHEAGARTAQVGMVVVGLLLLRRLEVWAGPRSRLAVLVGGCLLSITWTDLAIAWVHPDDVLVLGAAVVAVTTSNPPLAALLAGASAAGKPWGAPAITLAARRPLAGRALLGPLALSAAVPLILWLPFVVGDPRTLPALSGFHLHVYDDAPLHLLVHGTAPGWVRPAQLALGLAVSAAAVRRGRPEWVPAALVGARLLLDPQTLGYYTAGLVLTVLLVDVARGRAVPWWTLAVTVLLVDDTYVVTDSLSRTLLRAATCLVVLAAAALPVGRGSTTPEGDTRSAQPSLSWGGAPRLKRAPAPADTQSSTTERSTCTSPSQEACP